jgi:hypothetical protein
MAGNLVSQLPLEVLVLTPRGPAAVSQLALEILINTSAPPPNAARLDQLPLEVLVREVTARLDQLPLEAAVRSNVPITMSLAQAPLEVMWREFTGLRITINGVDVTHTVRSAMGGTIGPMRVNELSTAHFQFLDGQAPNRGDTLVAYAIDGVTPIFAGLVRKRTATSYARGLFEMVTDVDVDDWWIYLDTSIATSRVYTGPVTLKAALTDLVADCGLGAAGFTVDPAQVDGPTFPAFAWSQTGAAEAVRTLSTWSTSGSTSYVARISPTKVIRMFVPGTDPAPVTITDAAPNVEEIGWADPDAIPYTKVALWCGPAGPIDYTQHWTQAGGATSWIADIPAASSTTAGYVTVGGIFLTVATYGDPTADPASYTWEWQTRTLRLSLGALPPDGTPMIFVYSAASPFLVTAGTGSIVSTSYDETILTLADGQRTADALLAKLNPGAAAKSWSIMSHDHGWQPGQGINVALTAPAYTGLLTINDVTIYIYTIFIWKYAIGAAETVIYQGSSADQWRALGVGVPGSGAAPSTLSGEMSGGLTQLTGDVTAGPGSGSEVATIANDAVTYAKFQNVSAAARLLGRGSAAGAGDVQELTLGTGLSMTGTTVNVDALGAGAWINVPFNAANFAGTGGMSWTVASGNVVTNQYAIVGKILIWLFNAGGTTLSGTPGSSVQMTAPFPSIFQIQATGQINVPGTPGWAPSFISNGSGSTFTIYQADGSPFPAVGTLYLSFQLIIPIA